MRKKAEETHSAENDLVRDSLETVLKGLGFCLIELSVSRHRGSVRIRAVIYNGKGIGTDDCSKVHRAVMPRLELAFEGNDIYLEVSSPGIDRLIKDTDEFAFFLGRGVRCYRTDITEWTAGLLESVNEEEITIKTKEGILSLKLDNIAKAKLDSSQEV
ncbi:MAG: ribosome assembly cofactor RimP [Treponema sp.]|nr:ribosome assembly cofactor RimP [Treponema sp.]MCL2237252.1 ribosome assembly cofactor RimP [Treponema sp.]